MKTVLFGVAIVAPLCFAVSGFSQEADKKQEASQPQVTKVSGVFQAVRSAEVKAGTEQVKSLKIKRSVPHGSEVKKGQPIIWFETEDVDKQLSEAETSLRLAELAMRESALNFEQLHTTQKLDKAAAERVYRNAKQDYDNFTKTDLQRQILAAEFGLKSSHYSLENALEELKQLEQMYKEDEITEASEEIVLKRAKRAVESARFRLQGEEINTQRSLQQKIPRGQEQQEDAFTRQQLAYDKTLLSLELNRQRQEIELNKTKKSLAKQKADLQQLREDRKHLVLQAPEDGILYHGALHRGRVSDKPGGLAEGTTVTNKQVLATLVRSQPLQIRLDLAEKDLQHIRVGAPATASPTGFPDRKLPATVKSLSYVPIANGKFDCVLTVKLGKAKPAIMPGMSCSVEFVAEAKK